MRGLRGPAERRVLLLLWHAWAYWLLAVALAAAAPWKWMATAILALYVAFWLFGVVRAALQRDSTLVARCVGIVVFALAWVILPGPEEPLSSRPGVSTLPVSRDGRVWIAVQLAAILVFFFVIAVVHAALFRSLARNRRIRSVPKWLWPAAGFPSVVLAAMLLFLAVPGAAELALVVFAVLWLCGLVWAREDGEQLRPRWIGLGAAVCVLALWPPVSLVANQERIVETVLGPELKRDGYVVFLRIGGEDPSDDLLRRLSAAGRPVKPRSAAGRNDRSWVIDPETGSTGVALSVRIRRSWSHPLAIEVNTGSYGGPLCGEGRTYWVAWWFGRWIVVHEETDWVS